jgi:hypothetical protein
MQHFYDNILYSKYQCYLLLIYSFLNKFSRKAFLKESFLKLINR